LHAYIFGPDFQPRHKIPLNGSPTRARVSPDGRYAATTAFVFGHSYADANFSTQTTIIDVASGTPLGDLERFTVLGNGQRIRSPDFNFWGVTFARDSNRFYATLRTAGKTYLVEGDVAARTMRVLRENVECPSLSPDNTRLAFKKLVGDGPAWRLHVLDLATMTETAAAETRSIDDQVEWLDDQQIVYAFGADLWVARADGKGAPRTLLSQALSPAVVR
jgi:Tol biopolymer transport system component